MHRVSSFEGSSKISLIVALKRSSSAALKFLRLFNEAILQSLSLTPQVFMHAKRLSGQWRQAKPSRLLLSSRVFSKIVGAKKSA
jgi:hypothetical protein